MSSLRQKRLIRGAHTTHDMAVRTQANGIYTKAYGMDPRPNLCRVCVPTSTGTLFMDCLRASAHRPESPYSPEGAPRTPPPPALAMPPVAASGGKDEACDEQLRAPTCVGAEATMPERGMQNATTPATNKATSLRYILRRVWRAQAWRRSKRLGYAECLLRIPGTSSIPQDEPATSPSNEANSLAAQRKGNEQPVLARASAHTLGPTTTAKAYARSWPTKCEPHAIWGLELQITTQCTPTPSYRGQGR